MKIAINAISATTGGARTYLLNLARALPSLGRHEYQLYIPGSAAPDLAGLPGNFELLQNARAERSYVQRLVWEQSTLPRRVSRWGANVLICTGNFCPLRSSVPVILLSRNALYFTPLFTSDLLERRHYFWALRHAALSRLGLLSAQAARLTVTPTEAMAKMIRAASGNSPVALRTIPHGFDPWPSGAEAGPPPPAPPFRFLLVSHYNYFRNFETVFRALADLRGVYKNGHVKLVLTTDIRPGLRLGGYDTTAAHRLMTDLGLLECVSALGAVPYDGLPRVYGSAHAVICPSYVESFSHTLVEAMGMGIPVIASDIPAHREVAGDAAVFFSPRDPSELAARCRSVMEDEDLRGRLRAAGRERARHFSWRRHFEELLSVAAEVAR